jgi:hypothetical protein
MRYVIDGIDNFLILRRRVSAVSKDARYRSRQPAERRSSAEPSGPARGSFPVSRQVLPA